MVRDLQNIRLCKAHAIFSAVEDVLPEGKFGQKPPFARGADVRAEERVHSLIAQIEHGGGVVLVRLPDGIGRDANKIRPRRVRYDVVAGELLRGAPLLPDGGKEALVFGRVAQNGEIGLLHVKDGEHLAQPREVVGIGVRGEHGERRHLQSLQIAHERIVRGKRAVSPVDEQHFAVGKFHRGGVPLPHGEKVDAQFPLAACGDGIGGQQSAEGNDEEKERHGAGDEHHKREPQPAQKTQGAPPFLPRHLRFLRCFRAAARAASISGRRSFASR